MKCSAIAANRVVSAKVFPNDATQKTEPELPSHECNSGLLKDPMAKVKLQHSYPFQSLLIPSPPNLH